ncbi:monovalent cation/H+ antiporter complex subunit F, partial [Paenibacillus sp. AD87]
GPSMADRITALDTIGINVIAIVAVLSMMLHTQAYLDIILLIGILAFLSTVAFARYIERGAVFKNEGDR